MSDEPTEREAIYQTVAAMEYILDMLREIDAGGRLNERHLIVANEKVNELSYRIRFWGPDDA